MKQTKLLSLIFILTLGITLAQDSHERTAENVLALPTLEAIPLDGDKLNVIATTSIIGDIVANIAGDAINLTTLMQAGQDPHSYDPVARDLVKVSQAHLVFVNGWNLEEGLLEDLEAISSVPLIAVSANLEPLQFGETQEHAEGEEHEHEHEDTDTHEDHSHSGIDPHTWLSIHNVEQWVHNIQEVLSQLDPPNNSIYANNAAAYLKALEDLEAYAQEQFAGIPDEKRFLVTNHDSLGYLARDYDLEVIATVIPTTSTLAEPSARELAALIEEMRRHEVCTIFAETISRNNLAQMVINELNTCTEVELVTLYTGALGSSGSRAETYLDMYRVNVDLIVQGLKH